MIEPRLLEVFDSQIYGSGKESYLNLLLKIGDYMFLDTIKFDSCVVNEHND